MKHLIAICLALCLAAPVYTTKADDDLNKELNKELAKQLKKAYKNKNLRNDKNARSRVARTLHKTLRSEQRRL